MLGNELERVNERLQALEDQLRAKEERIKKLEEMLSVQENGPREVSPGAEPQGERVSAVEKEMGAPFGGEFSLMPGGQGGPFGTGEDFFIAGALDIPLFQRDPLFGQKLFGEILIGYGRSTDQGVFTSPLTLFAPSLGMPAGSAVVSGKLETKFLQVFLGAKYKLVHYGMERLQRVVQPYLVTGLGLNVLMGRTTGSGLDLDGDGSPDVSLGSLGFPGGLIGGVTPEPGELFRRGFPTGQGNIKLGYSVGGGLDVNLTERMFVGADVRYNLLDGGGDYGTYTGKVGFRW